MKFCPNCGRKIVKLSDWSRKWWELTQRRTIPDELDMFGCVIEGINYFRVRT